MMKSAATVLSHVAQSSRRQSVRRAFAVSLVAVLIGASGCSKNKNEDAVEAQDSAVEQGETRAERSAAATTERSSAAATRVQEQAQEAVTDEALYGYWVVDTDATVASVPAEARDTVREVLEQAETGIAFTPTGHAVMTVTEDDERSDQHAKFSVVESKGALVKIEFHLDDPRFEEMGLQAFANIEHVDAQTIRYQPYTVENGVAQASEHVVVMKRASAEDFESIVQQVAAD